MPFKFNPFTGNFDQTGSGGGGGGSSYIDGEVQNFSALPQTVGSPAVDSAYLVREAEGAWLLNRKPAGIYIRTANTGTRASDWTYAGEFPDVFNDANFVLYDDTDSTKNAKFQLSSIATGTTRTITVPNKNVTLDDAGDSRTPTAHAASHASSGSDPVEVDQFQVRCLGGAGVWGNDETLNDIFGSMGNAIFSDPSDFAAASHTHELTALAATGATNGHVLTANGSGGVTFAAAPGGGVTGAASSASDVLGVSGANITGVDANADRIIFFDDSAGKLTHLTVGSGLSISDTTISATASGGSKTYAVFAATDNQPPSTAFATLDTRGTGIAVLDFDAATDENAVFVGIMPEAASLGSGLVVRLHWMATTATSGNVRWGVQFERSNTDLDADSFDTAVEATAATNGTSGIITTTAITVTTIDGITAGDVFRLKVFRNADDATNDTMTGDAELVAVEVRSAA